MVHTTTFIANVHAFHRTIELRVAARDEARRGKAARNMADSPFRVLANDAQPRVDQPTPRVRCSLVKGRPIYPKLCSRRRWPNMSGTATNS